MNRPAVKFRQPLAFSACGYYFHYFISPSTQNGANMRKDSALILLDELDIERSQLVEQARVEILQTIDEAIDQLDRLGFSFSLVEKTGLNGTLQAGALSTKNRAKVSGKKTAKAAPGKPAAKRRTRTGTRRTGIREDVLTAIAASGKKGMTRGDLIGAFKANDSAFKQSISNALAALKKQKQVKAANGVYRAAA